MTPAQRWWTVEHLKAEGLGSERRVCRLMALSRSVARDRRQGRSDTGLRERLKALAQEYPRYGCPTLHDLLKSESQVINIKRTYRLYGEERLQVRRKRRRKLRVPRVPMLVPSSANERWRMHYNHVRPHRSIGRQPPAVFAASVA